MARSWLLMVSEGGREGGMAGGYLVEGKLVFFSLGGLFVVLFWLYGKSLGQVPRP